MTRRVITAREQHEMLSPWRTASWFHPEIGIEEYPALTRKERKALYSEIKAQGGPEVLSNIYHPENWGSGDPTGEHHYIARGQDGTIHGVLAATRSYKKTEPKRPGSYSSLNVHDIYTGADAPKGTGTVLMQAAAHRAMRDGASFGVSGAVHSARPFYHNLGGTTDEINLSSGFYWEPEDRDALAMGKPNRKPVTPMPLDVWNPELKKYEKHYKMPPGADEPPEFGDIFVDNSLRQRQTTAATDPQGITGVNINDDHQDYTGQILRGEKTIETRNTPTLHHAVGQRIALVSTRRRPFRPALVVGYATIGKPVFYPDADSFDADYSRHLVDGDSPHHITSPTNKTGTKYGYPMLDVEDTEPFPAPRGGIVTRKDMQFGDR